MIATKEYMVRLKWGKYVSGFLFREFTTSGMVSERISNFWEINGKGNNYE
jgi:hypothetical protein